MINKGKKWEKCVKDSWEACFPSSLIMRLPDQQSGYKATSKNPCDLIGFTKSKLFLIECKTVAKGNTISFDRLTQYADLVEYSKYENVEGGFIVWWQEKFEVAWFPIEEVIKIKEEGNKSLNIKMLKDERYKIIRIPSEYKRVYPKCDLTKMVNEKE